MGKNSFYTTELKLKICNQMTDNSM